MREIKFRAWDKTAKKMIYKFSLSSVSNGDFLLFPDEWPNDELNKALKLYDETGCFGLIDYSNFYFEECVVMQYTGIKDKNGKEIYEGDIVDADSGYGDPRQVVYDLENIFYWKGECMVNDSIEIIGNIHENPELIKGLEK